jgi:HEAT repeat protein
MPLFQERLKPVPRISQARIDQLIADLDSNRFTVRNKATKALQTIGDPAIPALRRALLKPPSEEVARRAKELLARFTAPVPPPDQLRLLRALAALEEIGTPEARRLLESLAQGAPEARLTREARAVLKRLGKRKSGP